MGGGGRRSPRGERAGKSTLIKVLAGVYIPEAGDLKVRGEQVHFIEPIDALNRGIATVHQHSSLANNLTVAQNLVLGREPGVSWLPFWIPPARRHQRGSQDHRAVRHRPAAHNSGGRPHGRPEAAGRDRPGRGRGRHVDHLDEPTAALNPASGTSLFDLINTLKSSGIPVLYVSHRLDEIPRICDRDEVLRDGKNVGGLDRRGLGAGPRSSRSW